MVKRKEKRRHTRHRCRIQAEFSVFSSKTLKGKTAVKNVSKGGLKFLMRKAPLPDTIIVINVDPARLSKFLDYNLILLDPSGNPIARVMHISRDKDGKGYNVGVRFLPRPSVVPDEILH